MCLLMQTACFNFIWHPSKRLWLSHILWRITSLSVVKEFQIESSASSCVWTCPPRGPYILRLPLHLFRVFIMIFPAALWHIGAECESPQTYVCDEKQAYNWSNTQHPYVSKYPIPSPCRLQTSVSAGPTLSPSCSSGQDLTEDSTKSIMLADSSPYPR